MIPSPAEDGARARQTSYVYLLKSRHGSTFYVGWTTDPVRRLVEHNQRMSRFTRRFADWQLVGFERYPNPEIAKARERSLKRNPRMLRFFKKRLLNRAAVGRPRQVMG